MKLTLKALVDVNQILIDCQHESILHPNKGLSEFIQNFTSYYVYRQNDTQANTTKI